MPFDFQMDVLNLKMNGCFDSIQTQHVRPTSRTSSPFQIQVGLQVIENW